MAQHAPDREKALELAIAQIEKNHGKGSVMRLGDEVRQPISVIPTGSIALDVALGFLRLDPEAFRRHAHRGLSKICSRHVVSFTAELFDRLSTV